MSVFQLQDWWRVQISEDDDEEFDHGCMVVGNIDNSSPSADKIAVGSLKGIIRIYYPTKSEFRVEDLILEESLGVPILQLLLGHFVPSSPNHFGVAVLHPRKLIVFELVPKGQLGSRANYYSLEKLYEHDLGLDGKHFTAYNMTHGPIGGVRGRDMIIVQSMDGKIQIFEQSTNSLTRQLVDCLLPGPMGYLPKLDAFVTCNYATRAECYRYQVLVSSQTEIGSSDFIGTTKSAPSATNFGLVSIRSALVEWSVNLGDPCRQILIGRFSKDSENVALDQRNNELLFLCEKSLYLLKDTGAIIQMRRLEQDPSCIYSYFPTASSPSNFLLATMDATIQVFSEFNLVWAAKLSTVPVQLSICTVGSQRGLITSIDSSGLLRLSYLGTKPPVTAIVNSSREVDFDKIDEEHKALLQVIRDSQSDSKIEPNERLIMRTQIAKTFDPSLAGVMTSNLPADVVSFSAISGGLSNENGANSLIRLSIKVFISFSGSKAVTNVSLTVAAPAFLHIVPSSIVLETVKGSRSTPNIVVFDFFATKSSPPASLNASIIASYLNSKGEPQVVSVPIALPLALACSLKPASKTAAFKFVLDSEAEVAEPLTDLFDDFLYLNQEAGLEVADTLGSSAAYAMGFQFWFSDVVKKVSTDGRIAIYQLPVSASIQVSKTSARYRIQSDSMQALSIISIELERRIVNAVKARSMTKALEKINLLKFSEPLPLTEYVAVITEHFSLRVALQSLLSKLNDKSHQFRVIEKRLLVRFKDKNPAPLGGLDIIMRETYSSLILISDQIEETQLKIKRISCHLESFSRLMTLLISLKFSLSDAERSLLESHLCPNVRESASADSGWEEIVDASLTYLLKTSLAKSVKESTTLSSHLELAGDIEPLKKHLGMVIDRLSKGIRLIPDSAGNLK